MYCIVVRKSCILQGLPVFQVPSWPCTYLSYYWVCSLCCNLHSSWLFCNYWFVLLNPFTIFTWPHPVPFPPENYQSVLCICESVSVLFACLFCSLDSTHKWNQMVFVFLCLIYFTLLIPMLSRSIHTVAKGKILFFPMAMIFHCVNVPLLFYPLIYWCALGLLP